MSVQHTVLYATDVTKHLGTSTVKLQNFVTLENGTQVAIV